MRFENVIEILKQEAKRLDTINKELYMQNELDEYGSHLGEIIDVIFVLNSLNRKHDYVIDFLKKEEQRIEEKYKDNISGDIAYILDEIEEVIDILEKGLKCLKQQ